MGARKTAAPLGSPLHQFAALLIFLGISIALFGLRVLAAPASAHVGFISDPAAMIWCMAWWPHAIAHRLNPFITKAIWAPIGYNLTWATSIPAVALAFAPLTAAFGPVLSYNCAAVAAPALSAWSAYLLCRRLTSNPGAAFAGGLIYGFSPYEVGHVVGGHLSLTPIFVPPLCVLLTMLVLDGDISFLRFGICLTLLLVLQFLISNEILATMTVFGAAALVVAFVVFPGRRRQLITMLVPLTGAYAAGAVVLIPFLYFAFIPGAFPRDGFFSPLGCSADLLSFVVPGMLLFMHFPDTTAIAAKFGGNMFENGAYFSLPLIAVAGWFFWSNRREPAARLSAVMLLIVALAALGPELHIGGSPIAPLPWLWTQSLPLIRFALPARFACYGFLVLAVVFAAAISQPSRWRRVAAAAVALALFPNPDFLLARSTYDEPPFFSHDLYRSYLRRGENVLIMPYAIAGPSMAWQAQSAMYFRMAGGYMGIAPEEFRRWPLLSTLTNSIPVPYQAEQLRDFVAAHRVDTIIVAEGASAIERELPLSMGLKPVNVGGVSLFRIPQPVAAQFNARRLQQFQQAAADRWLMMLVCAADRFVGGGGNLNAFNPAVASRLGLLPGTQWSDSLPLLLAGLRTGGSNGLWIGPGGQGTVEVGLPASGAVARALAARYTAAANELFYPYPRPHSAAAGDDGMHFLLMKLPSAALASCRPDVAANKR